MKTTDKLRTLVGSVATLSVKAQQFHWNVTGPDFAQYHELFAEYYSDVYGSLDTLAEYIRILGEFSPTSLKRFLELSEIKEQEKIPKTELMFRELLDDTNRMIELYIELFDLATADKHNGIANFAADQQDRLGKWAWKFTSILK